MTKRWPTEEELQIAQQLEYTRAQLYDDEADPICECGYPGWCCNCERMAEEIGYWPDGSEHNVSK